MKRAGALVLGFVALVGLADAAVGGGSDPFEAFGLVRLDRGARAPVFTLPDLAGNPTRLITPGTSSTLVVFWGSW